jgi:hypothetical protein
VLVAEAVVEVSTLESVKEFHHAVVIALDLALGVDEVGFL